MLEILQRFSLVPVEIYYKLGWAVTHPDEQIVQALFDLLHSAVSKGGSQKRCDFNIGRFGVTI